MSVLNISAKFEIKDVSLKSTPEGGGGAAAVGGGVNFRFKYEKRWTYLVCHLKTKEYIRGVLSAKGPPADVRTEAGVCVCVCARVKVEGRHYKQVMSEIPLTPVFSRRFPFK